MMCYSTSCLHQKAQISIIKHIGYVTFAETSIVYGTHAAGIKAITLMRLTVVTDCLPKLIVNVTAKRSRT